MFRLVLCLLFISLSIVSFCQRQITVKVVDGTTKKPVKDALVKLPGTASETRTNVLGFFQLTIDALDSIVISSPDHEAAFVKVPPNLNTFSISLTPLPPIAVQGLENQTQQEKALSANEEHAKFPGGLQAFYEYVFSNLDYPTAAHRLRIEGKVFVTFTVDSLGTVKDPVIQKGIGAGCDEEALRLVAASPKWLPARQNGTAVQSKMGLPIIFRVDMSSPKKNGKSRAKQ